MSGFATENKEAITKLLDRKAGESVDLLVQRLAKRPGVAAILFYGNRLRETQADGLIDLYVLTDSNHAYHGTSIAALFNKLLPPNVYFEEIETETGAVQAKVAVMSLSAFARKMRPESLDTTLWARFSQPAILAFHRDEESRNSVINSIICGYETALWWALRLSPEGAAWKQVWTELFVHTYQVELRVESSKRADTIIAKAPDLYEALFRSNSATPSVNRPSDVDRKDARSKWARRRIIGKILNFLRLVKAAFTFKGGISYALAKVEKHSGRPVELKSWERRLPWLAAPIVFCRLLIERRLR